MRHPRRSRVHKARVQARDASVESGKIAAARVFFTCGSNMPEVIVRRSRKGPVPRAKDLQIARKKTALNTAQRRTECGTESWDASNIRHANVFQSSSFFGFVRFFFARNGNRGRVETPEILNESPELSRRCFYRVHVR